MKIGRSVFLSVVGLHLFCAPAQAQSHDDKMDERTGDLQEVIVTAQKREQSINDVGETIAAIGAASLAAQRIAGLDSVAQAVPGLQFTPSNTNTPVLTLRGVGFYDNSLAAAPAVTVYLDEVPLSFPVLASLTAFDLERIEVLKGPQGTLFGENSTGGALNYIAAKPTDELKMGASLGFGRFENVAASGFISSPVSDTLKLRLAVKATHQDDWLQSTTRDDTTGAGGTLAARFLADWRPSDPVKLSVNLNGWHDTTVASPGQYLFPNPQGPTAGAGFPFATFPRAPDSPRATDWSPPYPPRADSNLGQAALRGDFKLNDDLIVTAISSYTHYDQRKTPLGSGTPYLILDVVDDRGDIKTFSQEIRLANGGSAATRWVLGGNYERSRVAEDFVNLYPDSTATPALGITQNGAKSLQHIRNYAFFGNIEHELLESLSLKAGVRYTESKHTSSNCGYDLGDGAINGLFDFLGALLSGNPATPQIQPGQCYQLGPAPSYVPGTPFNGELNQSNASWRVGADYRVAERTLVYANVSRGYKAGGFPTLGASVVTQYAPVVQEEVLAYEGGIKTQLFERKLDLNTAAFYYDYKNKQIKSRIVDPVFGLLDQLVNVPKSKIKGVELEATLRPFKGLTLQNALTYTDAHIDEYSGVDVAGNLNTDFHGTQIPYTSKWQARVNADYEWTIAQQRRIFLGGSLSYRSEAWASLGGERLVIANQFAPTGMANLYRLNPYALLDLRAGIKGSDDRWTLTVYGQNVANKLYVQNVNNAHDVIVRYVGAPATYGITLSVSY